MSGLKLGKLPDRNPVKLTVNLMPDLHQRLIDYAVAYREAYGIEEPVAELVPAMLSAFLDGDRVFGRRGASRKAG